MYGLRKVNKNKTHYDFTWDLTIGAVNTAPDWNPKVECGTGLHLLPNAQGDYSLLDGHYWVVVEFDETKMVKIDDEKAKVESCTIVHVSETTDGLLEYFKDVTFNGRSAYGWARDIGDRDHMKPLIIESEWAYNWACDIGDKEHMKPMITESQWAYYWARLH